MQLKCRITNKKKTFKKSSQCRYLLIIRCLSGSVRAGLTEFYCSSKRKVFSYMSVKTSVSVCCVFRVCVCVLVLIL